MDVLFPMEPVGVKGKVSSRKLSSSRLREVGGGSGEGSVRGLEVWGWEKGMKKRRT